MGNGEWGFREGISGAGLGSPAVASYVCGNGVGVRPERRNSLPQGYAFLNDKKGKREANMRSGRIWPQHGNIIDTIPDTVYMTNEIPSSPDCAIIYHVLI